MFVFHENKEVILKQWLSLKYNLFASTDLPRATVDKGTLI